MNKFVISRTVWILCFVSLFNDIGSEMLIPVMPVYLKSIGFSVLLIGILEGMAEAVAGLTKGYFGHLSDIKGRRLPFVQAGYLMSAMAKPVMGLFTHVWWVFAARTTDRLGKGVRTAARDALLSDEATAATKGRIFGLHRSFDTIGAICGPLLALLYLHFYPGQYKWLFMLAAIPGILTIACTTLVREKKPEQQLNSARPGLLSFLRYWPNSSPEYGQLVAGLIVFALINSSDAFLLLKMKETGYSDQAVIGIYIFYNVVYAIAAYPFGHLGDHFGLKPVFILGVVLFAVAYAGLGWSNNIYWSLTFFAVYGLYAAVSEGISKAWITNITPGRETATAIGTYTAFQSIASLAASILAGWIWYQFGSIYLFMLSACVALLVAAYLFTLRASGSKSPV